MSWLILLLAQAPAAATDHPEIIVVAERFNRLQATVGRDPQGRWHCSLDGTSGAPRLDDRLCRAVTKCARKQAKGGKPAEACIADNRKRLLAQWKHEAARR